MRHRLKDTMTLRKNRIKRRWSVMMGEAARIVTILLVAGGFSVVMVYAYNFAMCTPHFSIKETVVRGCQRLQAEAVIEQAAVPADQNILIANIGEIRERVAAIPEVRKAYVGRELPNRLVVEIVEREPVARACQNGEVSLMDRDGVLFTSSLPSITFDLPVVTGLFSGKNQALVEDTLALCDYLAKRTAFPTMTEVAEIAVDEVYGFSLVTRRRMIIDIGWASFEGKLARLSRIIKDIEKRRTPGGCVRVDCTNREKIIVSRCRLNKKSVTGGYST